MSTGDLKARLRLIAAWKKPGGKTPSEKMPNVHSTCTQAIYTIATLEAEVERLREAFLEIQAPLGNPPEQGDHGFQPDKTTRWWKELAIKYRKIARAALEDTDHANQKNPDAG